MTSTDPPGSERSSRWSTRALSLRLPDFPWDRLEPLRQIAQAHPVGVVDLSVGTPVDDTPELIQAELRAATNAAGYPLTAGSADFRRAAVAWLQRRLGVQVDAMLPVIGTKELVAGLPTQLGMGRGDLVVIPGLAYPTYEVGARIAGADVLVADAPNFEPGHGRTLVWLNSPGNPNGRILSVAEQRTWVDWARRNDAVVVSDECYAELWWTEQPISLLHESVSGGDHRGLLAVHSLSKRSNLAGYRAGFITGDSALVAELLDVRRNAGLMIPAPIQAAAVVALDDDEHVAEQVARYGRRRTALAAALTAAGFRIEHSGAGLYLWATRDEDCWKTASWLAERGILVALGDFYGVAGHNFVRLALTATDERISAAVARLV
ncbi:MAG: succinyldiaminopimelate transaminase [Actinomycetes bacterium]